MTFKRLSALMALISKYQHEKRPDENVVILISFDQLSELRAKCAKSMILTHENKEYFMEFEIVMVHERDYLAVAFERDGKCYKKEEVKS